MELLQSLEPWHWWIFAVALLALEALAPGAIFLWMGIAAAFVGAILWAIPLSWESQLTLFSFISVMDIVAWRIYRKHNPAPASPMPLLNKRMERYIGKVLTLDKPIEGGSAQIKMNDSIWKVVGPDLPVGSRVKIVGYDGPVLRVEPAD